MIDSKELFEARPATMTAAMGLIKRAAHRLRFLESATLVSLPRESLECKEYAGVSLQRFPGRQITVIKIGRMLQHMTGFKPGILFTLRRDGRKVTMFQTAYLDAASVRIVGRMGQLRATWGSLLAEETPEPLWCEVQKACRGELVFYTPLGVKLESLSWT